MRGLAQHLGLGAMTLYTYVANRNDLVVLMVDQVLGRTGLPAHPDDLRARLELVARVQYDDCRAHPWLLEVVGRSRRGSGRTWPTATSGSWRRSRASGSTTSRWTRPSPCSPSFAAGVARAEQVVRQAERESGHERRRVVGGQPRGAGRGDGRRDYPLAGRVGTAAGEAYQAGSDPRRELDFGLARIVDGLLAHLAGPPNRD